MTTLLGFPVLLVFAVLCFGKVDIDCHACRARGNFVMSDSNKMPIWGLGVYLSGEQTRDAVKHALREGYTMIDTAQSYENEDQVAQAIRDVDSELPAGLKRESIFVTTKVKGDNHGYEQTIKSVEESLEKMKLDYVDLILIHSPKGDKIVETWDALVELQIRGKTKSIGVSNFNIAHIAAITMNGRPFPAVNQIEMHPLLIKEREELIKYCEANNILVQAYGSLFFGNQDYLYAEEVKQVAQKFSKTEAQVLLRWANQKGFQIIPKSTKLVRIKENANIFDFYLGVDDMALLDSMEGELGAYWKDGNPLDYPVDQGETEKYRHIVHEGL